MPEGRPDSYREGRSEADPQKYGEMPEWSNAAVLKTVVRATGPGVRIPLSPPKKKA